MKQIDTFRSVIELWPSREAMASDIGARSSAISKWWQRDSIPAEWWSAILETGRASEISAETLTAIAAREAAGARA